MKIGHVLGEIILVLHKHKELEATAIFKKGKFTSIQTLLCALTNYCRKTSDHVPLRRKLTSKGVYVYYLLPSWVEANQDMIEQIKQDLHPHGSKKFTNPSPLALWPMELHVLNLPDPSKLKRKKKRV